ncbi:MAG: DUF3109 family protein [Dysgonamonadaceae bacterium]|jgi:hypothetical protein|nr:DUF3109 family protein [Dysgonamonadaceae bacterium]
MLQIMDTIISEDVLQEYFFCNLAVCKGICCVEGDAGAPVEESELADLKAVLPIVWNDLSPKAQAVIEKQGVAYLDEDGEYVTSIVAGEDCVFTCYDADGICRCAIEKAFREGKTDFYKPVSCHLYPVRVTGYNGFRAINFHRWNVCRSAAALGKREQVRAYQFLKEPLIRKFGEEWYQALCRAAKELNSCK